MPPVKPALTHGLRPLTGASCLPPAPSGARVSRSRLWGLGPCRFHTYTLGTAGFAACGPRRRGPAAQRSHVPWLPPPPPPASSFSFSSSSPMCSTHSPRHLPSHTLSRPLVNVAGLTPRFHALHGPCPSALRRRLNGAHPSGWASGLWPLPSCWPNGGSSRPLGRPLPRAGWLALPAALVLRCGLHFHSAFPFFFSPTHPPLYIILPPSSP